VRGLWSPSSVVILESLPVSLVRYLWFGGWWSVVVMMKGLFLEPSPVLSLGRVPPLLEGFWSIQIDTGISQTVRETSGKESKCCWIIQIHMHLVSKHLELRDVFVDVSTSHLELLKVIMGLLLLSVIHKGSLEVFFQDCPGGPSIKFVWIGFYLIQPVVVPLDPSSSFLSSDASHEVGTLLVGVLGNGRVSVHNHEPFESDQEIHSFASIALEEFRRIAFQSGASSSTIFVPVVLNFDPRVPIGVGRISTSSAGGVRTVGIIIIVVLLWLVVS
jgi:hypothetical protein